MSGLMGAKRPPPPPPAPEPTPMVDEEAIRKAKERAMRAARGRGGRASTVLGAAVQQAEKLGG